VAFTTFSTAAVVRTDRPDCTPFDASPYRQLRSGWRVSSSGLGRELGEPSRGLAPVDDGREGGRALRDANG
jgi:hypothetical protein